MRTFIAVGISREARQKIAQIQDDFKREDPDVKWVEPENLHLTLKFLGEVDEAKIAGVIEKTRLGVSENSRFKVHLLEIGTFPNLKFPRVVWIGVSEGKEELKDLSKRIEENLFHLGFPKENREFSAHLTIGRVRSPKKKEKLVKKIEELGKSDIGEFAVDKVLVMESQLSPKGPTYRVIEEVNLK